MEIKKRTLYIFTFLVIIILAMAFVSFMYYPFKQTGKVISEETKVLAIVNGVNVSSIDVMKAKQYIEAKSGIRVNQTVGVERAISEKLILQDAEKHGFNMTLDETEDKISNVLISQNQTLLDFKNRIESRGDNYELEIERYRKQFLIESYIEEMVPKYEITNAEALDYYNKNKELLFKNNTVVSYDKVSPQIKKLLMKKKGDDFINNYLKDLHESAEIVYLN